MSFIIIYNNCESRKASDPMSDQSALKSHRFDPLNFTGDNIVNAIRVDYANTR